MTALHSRQWFSRLPLAGSAVAFVAALTLWFPNMNRVPYEEAVPTVVAVLALSLLALALLRPIAGGWTRAGLMAGIAAVYLLYLPAPLFAIVEAPWLRWVLLAAAAAGAVLLARRIPDEPEPLLALNRRINLILLAFAVGTAGVAVAKQVQLERDRPDEQRLFAPFAGRAAPGSPDVWHIVFDRYASRETLARTYGYDNRPFLDALRARGFTIGEGAFANYQRTAHSVASTLNGAYLDALAGPMARRQSDWVPIYRSMTASQALIFFERSGYRTVFAGSWWNPTRRSGLADTNINRRALPELGRLMLDQSALGFALRQLGLPFGDARVEQCRRASDKFARLRALAAEGGRKYVFAHFLVPHPPFVLNADGSCRPLAVAAAASRRDNYLEQVDYANREALRLIDAIRAGPRPAVIVIHSDEGPWPEPFVGDERFIGRDPLAIDWARLSRPQLREKMGIMLAIRPPDGGRIDPPGSPVNIYPAILRGYFGGDRPNLPDRHFLFLADDALYTFRDVGPALGQLE